MGGNAGMHALGDIHIYNTKGRVWRELSTSGEVPTPKEAARAVGVSLGRSSIIFLHGGTTMERPIDDLHALHVESQVWHRARIPKTPTVEAHTLTQIDSNRLLLFGGYDGVQSLNDAFVLTIPGAMQSTLNLTQMSWERVEPNQRPKPRCDHTAFTLNGQLVAFGGSDFKQAGLEEGDMFNDLWTLRLDEN
eukprot:c10864_g1_i1.p1 GENE.c10864_g1_i1~~c10864_g1_i1.p1  ORF type:complete len:191 (+),score=31.79 c10864_g1_i1:794-1366(+)